VTTTTADYETVEDRPVRPLNPDASRETAHGHTRPAWLFMTPFLVMYLAFVIGPAIYMLIMSFFDTSLTKSGLGPFAGLDNFGEALSSPDFWASMWHTIWFTILSTPPLVIIALALALLVSRVTRLQWLFRLAFFAPYVLPVSVIVLIWNWLYQPGFGLINSYLTSLGLGEVNWLGQPGVAMVSAVIATVWWTLGFNFVLYLAGLQEIPRDLYEAASMDGAGPWQQIRRITIPMLSRTTSLVIVLQIIASLKLFDQAYIMTSGGPNYATRPLLEYVYDMGFTDFRTGYAAAVSTLFFILVLAVSAVWVFLTRRQEQGF
jgi:multiple sugar transport system permease protein